MTGSTILDIIISLVFIFMLYSLLASALGEVVASFFGLRARNLREAIGRMLEDGPEMPKTKFGAFFQSFWSGLAGWFSQNKTGMIGTFYKSPAIRYLAKDNFHSSPSYIPAETFAETLTDILKASPGTDDLQKIRQSLGLESEMEDPSPLSEQTRQHLINLWEDSKEDIVLFQSKIETWYDHTMERCSGWYKKKVGWMMFIIGFVIAVFFNVNTLYITKELSKPNSPLLEQTIAQATVFYAQNDSLTFDEMKAKFDQQVQQDSTFVSQINSSFARGWDADLRQEFKEDTKRTILGWLITALAISLGGPFWFDLLNRLMRLRSSIRPEKSENQTTNSTA